MKSIYSDSTEIVFDLVSVCHRQMEGGKGEENRKVAWT